MNSTIKIDSLDSSKTPAAIGPYSKATRIDIGDKYMIFTSGAIGVDYKTGDLVSDEVQGQTRQALENLKNLLEENGSSLNYITKTLVFLETMDDFIAFNEVYASFFTNTLPARSTVAVKTLPKNAKVEIEAVAFSPKF